MGYITWLKTVKQYFVKVNERSRAQWNTSGEKRISSKRSKLKRIACITARQFIQPLQREHLVFACQGTAGLVVSSRY
jgi:hypothetical protein